jgi:hypothetical protein
VRSSGAKLPLAASADCLQEAVAFCQANGPKEDLSPKKLKVQHGRRRSGTCAELPTTPCERA